MPIKFYPFTLLLLLAFANNPLYAQSLSGSDKGTVKAVIQNQPHINGPSVFGVRPGSPLIYQVPVTGERPIKYAVDKLPAGAKIDPKTGLITGVLKNKGEYQVTIHAKNQQGEASRAFKIVVGDRIALTPPMGWSSWNCFGENIDQDKIMRAAKAMIATGLSQHGFTYINMDDGWQGKRTGESKALSGNQNFPDIKSLVDTIHQLGLKVGIYSTPMETSYAKFPGGSADSENGEWTKKEYAFGKVSFARPDAIQWARWGIDYLKYDWLIDIPHTEEMSKALHATGRDIVFSLSNAGKLTGAETYAKLAESWRTTGDIYDVWRDGDADWHYSVSELGFSQDRWAGFAGPGHWNDPDMLVVGQLGWGKSVKPTRLTPDQQYAHISLWCMLSAPLILGCDLERLDDFTLSLLTNDEVLAIDQDAMGKQAVRVGTNGPVDFYIKPLEDGSVALGMFSRADKETTIKLNKLPNYGFGKKTRARNLWLHQDVENFNAKTAFIVPADGVILLKLW